MHFFQCGLMDLEMPSSYDRTIFRCQFVSRIRVETFYYVLMSSLHFQGITGEIDWSPNETGPRNYKRNEKNYQIYPHENTKEFNIILINLYNYRHFGIGWPSTLSSVSITNDKMTANNIWIAYNDNKNHLYNLHFGLYLFKYMRLW